MRNKTCLRCGRELSQVQRWNKRKYCSPQCFGASHFKQVEWNGIKIRPGQALEILQLCNEGLGLIEAQQILGANYKAVMKIKHDPELAAFLPERLCLYCDTPLTQDFLQRKYCSSKCVGKAKRDRGRTEEERMKRKIEQRKREQAIEWYSKGLDTTSISQQLEVSIKKIQCWIRKSGTEKPHKICPEIARLRPLNVRLKDARSAKEWSNILHAASGEQVDMTDVTLVCGTVHGGGAAPRYADIVLHKLRQKLIEGKRYAFCNVLRNTITTIEWRGENFYLTRTIKTKGTFSWPSEELGDFLVITNAAFLHLTEYLKPSKTFDSVK